MRRLDLSPGVWVWRPVLRAAVGLLVVGVGCLLLSSSASAEFGRPFESALEGTPTGLAGALAPFGELRCVAVDSGEGGITPGNLWVGDSTNGVIDEFSSSDVFLRQLFGLPVNSCSFDDSTHELRSVGPREWVAVDNTGGMYAGDIYLDRAGNGETSGYVERVESGGGPVDFTCSEPDAGEYVEGNRLVGRPEWEGKPAEAWRKEAIEGVVVSSSGGSAGDIYVINNTYREVDVFTSAGCFVRAIPTTRVVERNGGKEVEELFVSELKGIAVDPSNGDVVVKGAVRPSGWAIAEFSSSGGFLGEFVGRSKSSLFGAKDLGGGIAVGADGVLLVAADEVGECEKSGAECAQLSAECERGVVSGVVCGRHVVDVFGRGGFYPVGVTGVVGGDVVVGGGGVGVSLRGTIRGAEDDVTGEGLVVSGCGFEYVSEEGFQESVREGGGGFSRGVRVPCVLDESGVSPEGERLGERNYGVSAEVGGLVSGGVYRYRVVVETALGEHGGVSVGGVVSFAAAGVPLVGGVGVGGVSGSSAVFRAGVDPRGSDTSYVFEFVSAGVYEAAVAGGAADPFAGGGSVPVPAGDAGSGDEFVSVSVPVGGLLPGTVYYFRVVASNGVGVTDGVGGTFATSPESVVGGGRGYELVTPPNKGDAEDMFGVSKEEIFGENFDVGYSSGDGDEFLLWTTAAFGPFPGAGESSYVFSRDVNSSGEGGWSGSSVASPDLGVQSLAAEVHDPSRFGEVGVGDIVGPKDEHVDVLVGPPGGPYTTVVSSTARSTYLVGASRDWDHAVVESNSHEMPTVPLALCSGAQEGLVEGQEKDDELSRDLFEWSAGRGCLSVVNARSGSEGGKLVSECGAVLGMGFERAGGTGEAVSGDGSKIFFTAPDPTVAGSHCWLVEGGGWDSADTPQVYMRDAVEGADGTRYDTIEVSAPESGVKPGVTYPSVYVGASEDGSRVFFVTKTELTKDAVEAKTTGLELYECEVLEGGGGKPKCRLTRVSNGGSGKDEGGVAFVAAVSEDGSSVYFEAGGQLAAGAPKGGGLYVYDTASETTRYIAPGGGYPSPEPVLWYQEDNGELVSGGEVGLNVQAEYYATPNGKFFLFASRADVTGYDSGGQEEIYRYDKELPVSEGDPGVQDNPVCVSCNPNGAPPLTGSEFTRSSVHFDNPAGTPPRGISENGEYVFFDTAESLVPQATNGKVDVYEWHEVAGSGGGTISLIGSGQESSSSFFLDSSEMGSNVFFGTHAALVPQDTDSEGDLYDARVCTAAEPCIKPPPPKEGQCEGDACQSPPSPPITRTPASFAFSGTGNLPLEQTPSEEPVKHCSKGKKLSHGKCVKPPKKKPKKVGRAKNVAKAKRVGKTGAAFGVGGRS